MRLRLRFLVLIIVFALAPMVAGASASYTFDSGLDGWGPWGSASDCVWDGAVGRAGAGSMAAGLSCLSPAFVKSAGVNPSVSFWLASAWAGLAGRVAVVLDPHSSTYYCSAFLSSSTTDTGVWDEQVYTCEDATVEDATQFHILIEYSGVADTWVDDFGVSNAALAPTATPTPVPPTATPTDEGPILVTATPTPIPFITPATPTPIPTWLPAATPTAIATPAIIIPPTATPGAPGDLYFPVSGGGLLVRARDFLDDWWVIIGPAGLAALTGIVLVKVAEFMRR